MQGMVSKNIIKRLTIHKHDCPKVFALKGTIIIKVFHTLEGLHAHLIKKL
jgi:hypothetical protein